MSTLYFFQIIMQVKVITAPWTAICSFKDWTQPASPAAVVLSSLHRAPFSTAPLKVFRSQHQQVNRARHGRLVLFLELPKCAYLSLKARGVRWLVLFVVLLSFSTFLNLSTCQCLKFRCSNRRFIFLRWSLVDCRYHWLIFRRACLSRLTQLLRSRAS